MWPLASLRPISEAAWLQSQWSFHHQCRLQYHLLWFFIIPNGLCVNIGIFVLVLARSPFFSTIQSASFSSELKSSVKTACLVSHSMSNDYPTLCHSVLSLLGRLGLSVRHCSPIHFQCRCYCMRSCCWHHDFSCMPDSRKIVKYPVSVIGSALSLLPEAWCWHILRSLLDDLQFSVIIDWFSILK